MPFRPYSQSDIARLGELAEVLNDCRAAFRDVVDQTNWTAAPGCPAANDQNDIAKDEDYTAGAEFKITKLLFFYLLAASEQLGGLAALYAQQEVLIPPSALIRSTIEHCAHALWVVGHPGEPVQDRLARAYVEELLSAEAAKRNSGYMLGEDDELHLQEVERFRALKAEIRAGFPEELTYEKSRPVLRGQKVLTPEECVAWMFEFVSRPVPAKVTEGVYGVYSNSTHPTLYAIARLWVREQHKGQMTLAPALSVKDHENELFPAIVAFYEALST